MKQSIVHVALVVKDYDEAIAFYTEKLHFTLVEDIYQPEQDKRWVVVSPPGSNATTLLLARASKPEQQPFCMKLDMQQVTHLMFLVHLKMCLGNIWVKFQ